MSCKTSAAIELEELVVVVVVVEADDPGVDPADLSLVLVDGGVAAVVVVVVVGEVASVDAADMRRVILDDEAEVRERGVEEAVQSFQYSQLKRGESVV